MAETAVCTNPTKPCRRYWRRRVGIALLVMLVLAAGTVALLSFLADREWRAAVAEADRLDPGWTFDDLEAKRAAIPDDQNSALCAQRAFKLLPDPWPPLPADGADTNEAILKSLLEMPPAAPLAPAHLDALTAAVAAAEPALAEVRKLKDMPKGRYPVSVDDLGIPGAWPANLHARKLAVLLTYDAILREQEGDFNGALESCRALVNLTRSLGDAPDVFAQTVRLELRSDAVRRIERTLAQGRPSPEAVASLQALLTDEEAQPVFLFGARASRAWFHQLCTDANAGKLPDKGMPSVVVSAFAGNIRAATLRATTNMVEIAKLPVEEQDRALRERGLPKQDEGPYLARVYIWPKLHKQAGDLSRWQIRSQAELRAAIAGVAAERYRRDQGVWPETLAALVPAYLQAVPIDPFDAQPLRYRRTADGVVIYSIGLDGTDDGGKLDHGKSAPAGTDLGVQLWDR